MTANSGGSHAPRVLRQSGSDFRRLAEIFSCSPDESLARRQQQHARARALTRAESQRMPATMMNSPTKISAVKERSYRTARDYRLSTKLALHRRFGHVPAEIGKEVASGNEAKKLVAVHDNRDAPPIEYAQQIIDFHIRLQCFQLIGHCVAHWIIKMGGVATPSSQ